MVDAELRRKIERFLNLSENDPRPGADAADTDYRSIYVYGDGNGGRRQVTLARGFTEDGGNLRKVIDAYLANAGKSTVLREKARQIGKGVLSGDAAFKTALRDASAEPVMRLAQDAVFESAYLAPAFAWCDRNGFMLPLSQAVSADSYLHSGQMSPKLVNSFAEQPPAKGGSEVAWMSAYLNARLAWFKRATGPLRTCAFRPQFFLDQIGRGNWAMDCPLHVSGKGSIC